MLVRLLADSFGDRISACGGDVIHCITFVEMLFGGSVLLRRALCVALAYRRGLLAYSRAARVLVDIRSRPGTKKPAGREPCGLCGKPPGGCYRQDFRTLRMQAIISSPASLNLSTSATSTIFVAFAIHPWIVTIGSADSAGA